MLSYTNLIFNVENILNVSSSNNLKPNCLEILELTILAKCKYVMDKYISHKIFNDYQKCDFKVYLNSINKKGSKSEYEKNEIQLKKEYATIAFKRISKNYPKKEIINSSKSLENKLTENYSIIYNTHASFNNLVCNVECILIQKNQSGLIGGGPQKLDNVVSYESDQISGGSDNG